MSFRVLSKLLMLIPASLLAGCNAIVLHPFGDVALQQRNLIIASTVLMLLIIVPVIALSFIFAWRYRASNTEAAYDPEWHHSTSLELVIWSAPLLIIIALGALTWIATHTLDPYRPIDRIAAGKPLPDNAKTLNVQVVALDWKWLFIYPDYGIATVNELAAPVDVPVRFQITASSVMNSFFIPALAGQIYAMPAMQTELNAVINQPGDYEGFSANYSGAGFSHMRFRFKGLSGDDFDAWVAKVKAGDQKLARDNYLELEKPSQRDPVRYYASTEEGLYHRILNLCVTPGKMCMDEMMAIDARGGLGMAGIANVSRLAYDEPRTRDSAVQPRREFVTALCADDIKRAALQPLVLSAPSYGATRFAP